MRIKLLTGRLESVSADVLVLPVLGSARSLENHDSGSRSRARGRNEQRSNTPVWKRFDGPTRDLVRRFDKGTGGAIESDVRRFDFAAGPGSRLDVHLVPKRRGPRLIRLSSITKGPSAGKTSELEYWRRLGGDAYQTGKRAKARSVAIGVSGKEREIPEIVNAVVEGARLSEYSFDRYKKDRRMRGPGDTVAELQIVVQQGKRLLVDALKSADVATSTACLARDLVNTPPSAMLPVDLLKVARDVARKRGSRIRLKVFNRAQLRRLGAGALLAVARGSSSEPYLIHLHFRPRKPARNVKTVVLIGKGVTFDSGGLSIKPGKGMEDMKCDMAGAACVLAVMKALTLLPQGAVRHEVHAIVPATENMVSGDSIKPGDVVFALNGKSIEILNTDAEGRLILADALSYARRLKPDLIIDLATLTGACITALGSDYAGLFANNAVLQEAIEKHARRAGELVWPLPIAPEYRSQLDSPVANLKNIGSGGPGATLGALFLQEFVPEKTPWVHLDIAGPAFVERGNEYTARGGTGFGVRTLIRLLQDLDALRLAKR